jgi:hypothetical protein
VALIGGRALGGCAARTAPPPREQLAKIDRGYPNQGQLAEILAERAPPREEALKKGIAVDRWELAGPFPARAGSFPSTSEDPLARRAAESLVAGGRSIVLTESMQCYAREIGRFVAQYGGLPEDDLQAFAAGRCGVLPIAPSFDYSLPSEAPDDDAALTYLRDVIAKVPAPSELGIWRGEGQRSRHVLLAAFGQPKMKLASVERAGGDLAVRVRGTILAPSRWIRAYSGEGDLRFHACRPTPGAVALLPDFDMSCLLASSDAYTVLEMLAGAPEAPLGRQVLMLIVPSGRPLPSTFQRIAIAGLPSRSGLLERFNAVRAQVGQAPLLEVPLQSRTAHALVPHYFAAASNKDFARLDFITLGMMAGWDVPGPLRDSKFLSFRGAMGDDDSSLLSQLLFFPSNRAVLLDNEARHAAIAAWRDDRNQGTWGLLATYTTFAPRPYPDVEAALLDELDHQRRARGRPRVLRVESPEATRLLGHLMEKLARGEMTPMAGLDRTVRTLSSRLRQPLLGQASMALAVDGWRPVFSDELVDAEPVAVVTKVGFYAAAGDHWGQYVGLFIYGPSLEPRTAPISPEGRGKFGKVEGVSRAINE